MSWACQISQLHCVSTINFNNSTDFIFAQKNLFEQICYRNHSFIILYLHIQFPFFTYIKYSISAAWKLLTNVLPTVGIGYADYGVDGLLFETDTLRAYTYISKTLDHTTALPEYRYELHFRFGLTRLDVIYSWCLAMWCAAIHVFLYVRSSVVNCNKE